MPPGVRIETLPDDDVPARLIGGSLKTLLYMAQLASISMDPWFSTVDALHTPDQVAIDLDPQPGATFAQILDVARWVHEVLDASASPGFPKTSGSEGLHIFIPLPPGTPYQAGMLFCQIVATMVAAAHPKVATVERTVQQAQGRHDLRGLPAEHRGQDARLRLQRARRARLPASRRRSRGTRCTPTSGPRSSRSTPCSTASARSAICGPARGSTRARTCSPPSRNSASG